MKKLVLSFVGYLYCCDRFSSAKSAEDVVHLTLAVKQPQLALREQL